MGGVELRRTSACHRTVRLCRGVAVAALMTSVAACSSDLHRFNGNPFASDTTARGPQVASAESRPAVAAQPLPPPAGHSQQAMAASHDVTGTTPSPRTWQWEGGTPV